MKPILITAGLLFVWTMTTAGMCVSDSPPRVVTQTVNVPIPVPCDPKVAARPAYPDTAEALKGAGADAMLALLYAGRTVRNGYIAELETAVKVCRSP